MTSSGRCALVVMVLALAVAVLRCSDTPAAPRSGPMRLGFAPGSHITLHPRYKPQDGLSPFVPPCVLSDLIQFSQPPESTYAGLEEIAGTCADTPATFAAYANGDTAWEPSTFPCLVTTDMPGFHRQLIAGDSLLCPPAKRAWDSTEVVTHGNRWYGPTGTP